MMERLKRITYNQRVVYVPYNDSTVALRFLSQEVFGAIEKELNFPLFVAAAVDRMVRGTLTLCTGVLEDEDLLEDEEA